MFVSPKDAIINMNRCAAGSVHSWKIYVKDDVLIVFELTGLEETDEPLAVYLASFQQASMENPLNEMGKAANLPAFRTNLSAYE